jgi:glycosyl transferase family 25
MVSTLKIDGIYVIHALKGYELHEKRVIDLFGEHNLSFEFVTDGDPKFFNKDILRKYFTPNISSKMTAGTLSCTLNHILAYEKMVKRKNQYALIFENDPFFLGDFTTSLNKMGDEINSLEKGFLISLENSALRFPSFWETRGGKHLFRATTQRMAGAYLIDLKGAENILNDIKQHKCDEVIDWWHNTLVERGIVKMYWAHPPLVEQGSHNGNLSSTISSKPKSVIRQFQWNMQKIYKTYFRRLFRDKRVIQDNRS